MSRVNPPFLFVGIAAALAGCGGGGGGGGTGLTGISIMPSSLSFTANQDDPEPPAAQTITITALGSGTAYIKGENGLATGLQCSGTPSCTLEVRPTEAPWSFPSPGTITNGLTFIGCADQACTTGPVANGRQAVTYTYTVTQGLDVAPGPAVAVAGVEGTPSRQTLTLTHPSGVVKPWHATFTPTGGSPAFATLSLASATADAPSPSTLDVDLAALPAGTYTGTLAITLEGTPRTINRDLTYTVASALTVSQSLSFVVDESTTSADLQQSLAIASGTGGALQWSASETSPWLALSQTTGDTTANPALVVSLVPAALERLPKGVHGADITLSPSAPFSPATVHVALDMRLPDAEFAMPRAVAPQSTGEVYVHGSGFAALPSAVSFGGNPAVASTVASDTSIRATQPPLPSGTYPIEVQLPPNQLALSRNRAELGVAAGGALGAADLGSPGGKYAIVYDDLRQTLYVANVGAAPKIEQLVWNGATWTPGAQDVPSLRDLALSPGGDALLALTADAVERRDPATLALVDSVTVPNAGPLPARSIAVGHDGRWLIAHADQGASYTSLTYYDPDTATFAAADPSSVTGAIRASADGSAIYLHRLDDVVRYDVQARTYTSGASGSSGAALSVSRDGARILVDGVHVYSADFSARPATLSAPSETLTAAAITPDGKRAYAYADSGKLYAFDLETFDGSGGFAQVQGSPLALASPVGSAPVVTTSVDGATVFIAGDARIAVQPFP